MLWVGAQQLTDIVIRMPEYQHNIESRLQKLRNPAGSGFAKAFESIRAIGSELTPSSAATKQAQKARHGKLTPGADQPAAPVPVQVIKEKPSMLDSLGLIGSSLVHFFATLAAVIILTLFILVKRSDLRNRLFRLFGQGRINLLTTAMDEAAQRVSRYLLTQSLVNGTFGLCLGVGLYVIGVPYAAFWGGLAAALRFIPYVGTWTAGVCPLLLSLAVFDGWKKPLLTFGLFVAIELGTSTIIEPWLYATRTGISSLAILLSAAFWTMLWGPIGLVVSTPLTVLLFVLGRYVPQLEFLYILLGDEPVLAPEVCYYQRLLALDEEDARNVVEDYLKEHTALELYDSVLLPALSLAEQDRYEHQLDDERKRLIYETTRELIDEVGEETALQSSETALPIAGADDISVVCVPARDEADEVVALMLAQVLRPTGCRVQTLDSGFVEEMLLKMTQLEPTVVIISALPPFAVNRARALCRRARQRCRGAKLVMGLWGATGDPKAMRQRLGSGCSEYVVHTLEEARLQLRLFCEQKPAANGEVETHAASETFETGEPLPVEPR